MPATFIPLLPQGDAASGGRPVPALGQSSRSFQPLPDAPAPPAAAVTKAPPTVPHSCEASPPVVTTRRENGQITQIRVQCSCGQIIELDCLY